MRVHIKLMSVSVCPRYAAVEVTKQDFLATLSDTRIVGNSACYPNYCLTTTICWPTCIIPTEINFFGLFEKIDIVNKALPYVINCVAWIVTVLNFICCCVIVAEFFTLLFGAGANSSYPVQCHHHSQNPSSRGDKLVHWFHPGHHTLQCIHNGKKFQEASQV